MKGCGGQNIYNKKDMASKYDWLINEMSEFFENEKPEFRYRQSIRMMGELRFKPNKILELAKGFTNSTQMINYRGENQKLINQAGNYIAGHKIDRPEWFDRIEKGNQETKEECLEILLNVSTVKEIYENKNLNRILNRMWSFYGKKKTKKLLPHLNWKRKKWGDEEIYKIISQYKKITEIRKVKKHKKFLTKLQIDKGVKYPKSYSLYLTMKTKNGGEGIRKKRGQYKLKNK